MGVLIVKGEGAVLGMNLGRPIVTNVDGDALFPNYFGEDLFLLLLFIVINYIGVCMAAGQSKNDARYWRRI